MNSKNTPPDRGEHSKTSPLVEMAPAGLYRLSNAQLDWLVHTGEGGDPSAAAPAYSSTPSLMKAVIDLHEIETYESGHGTWCADMEGHEIDGKTVEIAAARCYAAWRFQMREDEKLMAPVHLGEPEKSAQSHSVHPRL